MYFQDLLKEGVNLHQITNAQVKTKPEDCYTFSYTSGTTGPPKGAMMSHKNLLAFIKGFTGHKQVGVTPDDTYVSYLPLPHVMERGCALAALGFGAFLV